MKIGTEASSPLAAVVDTLVRVASDERREIGRRIAEARHATRMPDGRRMSQSDLAHELGMSDSRHVRYIEAGERNPYKWLAQIAGITGKPVNWFYGTPADEESEISALRREVAEMRAEIRQLIRRRDEDDLAQE